MKILYYIIYDAINTKIYYVSKDLKDQNIRHILNYGHTFGHVIERKSNYRISHGKAVLYGILYSIEFYKFLGYNLKEEEIIRSNKIFKNLEKLNFSFNIKDFFYDKKKQNDYIDFVFIKKIGKPIIEKISWEKLNEFINKEI